LRLKQQVFDRWTIHLMVLGGKMFSGPKTVANRLAKSS
jgi:hypothetical protein